MRRIAYDLEFIEDGRTIDLVSIGMVNIDATAETLYLISSQFDATAFWSRAWLVENVAPHLPWGRPIKNEPLRPDPDDPRVMVRTDIRDRVVDFILGPLGNREPVQLWANYGGYDHVCLCQLWGGMRGHPDRMPMWSHDLQQHAEYAGVLEADLPVQDTGAHDALADALHLARCIRFLDAVLTGRG